MHNIFITLLLLITINYAKDIQPIATLETSGLVSDFVEDSGFLYVATDAGVVDVIDLFGKTSFLLSGLMDSMKRKYEYLT